MEELNLADPRLLRRLLMYKPDAIPLKLQLRGKLPKEQKLFLTVLLDALATMKGSERRQWLASDDFILVCKFARVEPSVARLIPAATAKKAWKVLRTVEATDSQVLQHFLDELEESNGRE